MSIKLALRMIQAALDIDEALKEVQEKDEDKIESETAYKWASRSIASYMMYEKTGELKWLIAAEDRRHEALEHASMIEDDGKILSEIRAEIDKHKPKEDKMASVDIEQVGDMFPAKTRDGGKPEYENVGGVWGLVKSKEPSTNMRRDMINTKSHPKTNIRDFLKKP